MFQTAIETLNEAQWPSQRIFVPEYIHFRLVSKHWTSHIYKKGYDLSVTGHEPSFMLLWAAPNLVIEDHNTFQYQWFSEIIMPTNISILHNLYGEHDFWEVTKNKWFR